MSIVEMVMPSMGESVMECTIISVLKKVGDYVDADDSVMEVATDKVDTEVPAPHGGIVTEILVKEGDVVAVGSVVMRFETQSETSDGKATNIITDMAAPVMELERQFETVAKSIVSVVAVDPLVSATADGRFYSPLVLNIAKTEGISRHELDQIKGSGIENRVTKNDILAYLAVGSRPSAIGYQSPANGHQPSATDSLPMDRVRKVIAERMLESQRISAHVTSYVETDMTNVVLWRNQIKEEFKRNTGEGLTFTPLLIEAVARAIKDFPLINISVEGGNILKKRDINIGMAVALPNGNLIVPVIHNADQYDLIGLTKKVNELAYRARQNKLTADDLVGGTYTVSNIGSFGNIMGTPIILQPQVAIMAFGMIQKRPVVLETRQGDVIGIRSMMYISHSYDHRVIDGALGGMFAKKVGDYLSSFDLNRKLF